MRGAASERTALASFNPEGLVIDSEVRELERKAAFGDRDAHEKLVGIERRSAGELLTGVLEVLGTSGHVEIRWSRSSQEDVSFVRRICDELQSTLKYRLFAKHQDGTTSLVGDGAFDPAVGRYVILPPLGGG